MSSFLEKARTVNECLHAYGIHSATLQPETVSTTTTQQQQGEALTATATATGNNSDHDHSHNHSGPGSSSISSSSLRRRRLDGPAACQIICSNLCQNLMCCTKIES